MFGLLRLDQLGRTNVLSRRFDLLVVKHVHKHVCIVVPLGWKRHRKVLGLHVEVGFALSYILETGLDRAAIEHLGVDLGRLLARNQASAQL